jgi:hypothetical protein
MSLRIGRPRPGAAILGQPASSRRGPPAAARTRGGRDLFSSSISYVRPAPARCRIGVRPSDSAGRAPARPAQRPERTTPPAAASPVFAEHHRGGQASAIATAATSASVHHPGALSWSAATGLGAHPPEPRGRPACCRPIRRASCEPRPAPPGPARQVLTLFSSGFGGQRTVTFDDGLAKPAAGCGRADDVAGRFEQLSSRSTPGSRRSRRPGLHRADVRGALAQRVEDRLPDTSPSSSPLEPQAVQSCSPSWQNASVLQPSGAEHGVPLSRAGRRPTRFSSSASVLTPRARSGRSPATAGSPSGWLRAARRQVRGVDVTARRRGGVRRHPARRCRYRRE